MKFRILAGSVLTALACGAMPAHSAMIVDLYGSGFSVDGLVSGESWDDDSSTVSGTFNAVGTADYAWVVQNEGEFWNNDTCWNSAAFPGGCTTYNLTLAVTNESGQAWTGFVLEFGYGGFWLTGDELDAFNDLDRGLSDNPNDDPVEFAEFEYERLDGGTQQPFSLISTSSGPWSNTEAIQGGIGIRWFDGVLNTGGTAMLGISLTIGDITGATEWESFFFVTKTNPWVPWTSGDPETAQLLTSRLYPTVASVPEPGPLALIAIGLVGLVFTRRRWAF